MLYSCVMMVCATNLYTSYLIQIDMASYRILGQKYTLLSQKCGRSEYCCSWLWTAIFMHPDNKYCAAWFTVKTIIPCANVIYICLCFVCRCEKKSIWGYYRRLNNLIPYCQWWRWTMSHDLLPELITRKCLKPDVCFSDRIQHFTQNCVYRYIIVAFLENNGWYFLFWSSHSRLWNS